MLLNDCENPKDRRERRSFQLRMSFIRLISRRHGVFKRKKVPGICETGKSTILRPRRLVRSTPLSSENAGDHLCLRLQAPTLLR